MLDRISNNVAFGSKVKIEIVNDDKSILENYPKKKAVLDKFTKQLEADEHDERTVTIKIGVDNGLIHYFKQRSNPFMIKVEDPKSSAEASCTPGFIGTYLDEEKSSIHELKKVYKEALKKAGMSYSGSIKRMINSIFNINK